MERNYISEEMKKSLRILILNFVKNQDQVFPDYRLLKVD